MTEDELQQVSVHYDLGELRAARRVERGFVNENWALETARGHYFLKRRHPDLHDPAVIRAQYALVAHLRQAGFPAPVILPAVSGEMLLALDGECYEIQEYIAGAPYDHDRPAHLAAAATMLGRYHTLVQGFAPLALDLGDLYSPAILRANLSRLAEVWAQDARLPFGGTQGRQPGSPLKRGVQADSSELASLLQQLETHAGDLAARFAGHETLPHLVIHGDYYAGNLLFAGDRIVGVVDYDKARWQPRVAELAEALIYFASPRPGHLKHLVYPGALEWEPFQRFLQGYDGTVALDETEMRALPDYIRCIWLQVSLQRLAEKDPRAVEAADALREVLVLGGWAAENAGRMSEMQGQSHPI